jgi:hypothetical protein
MGKNQIKDKIQLFSLLEELEGLKKLIQLIQTEESANIDYEKLKALINSLLFENNIPLINEDEKLRTARENVLGQTAENQRRYEEIEAVRERWVAKIVIWDIQRAIQTHDTESVWLLLDQIENKRICKYIPNQEDLQEILSKIADSISCSPDIMFAVLNQQQE